MNPRGDVCLSYFDGPLAHLEGVWYWNEQSECNLLAPEDIHKFAECGVLVIEGKPPADAITLYDEGTDLQFTVLEVP